MSSCCGHGRALCPADAAKWAFYHWGAWEDRSSLGCHEATNGGGRSALLNPSPAHRQGNPAYHVRAVFATLRRATNGTASY